MKIQINENRLKAIIAESIKNVLNEDVNKYECLNESNSSIGGQRKNSIASNLIFSKPNNSNTLVNEGVDWEVDDDIRGGIIVFSTDVNAVAKSQNKLVNYVKQKISTIINRFKATDKIDAIANKHNLVGWTIGHYFDGRYVAKNGKNFGENSITIDVVGVDDNKMITIAEDICREFEQECVLLKLHNGRILFVNPN